MKLSTTTSCLCARVTAAPAMGGMQMYQVKIACQGKCNSMYKTKEDFKSVLNMFKLVGAMNRAAAASRQPCACCASVSALTGTTMRVCDEDTLNAFLVAVLDKLRGVGADAIEACSAHRGVVQILMDFLSVRDGKYFCDASPADADALAHDDAASPRAVETPVQENDLDHPIAHCSLNRTLSQQFGAMDSVC